MLLEGKGTWKVGKKREWKRKLAFSYYKKEDSLHTGYMETLS